MKLKTLPENFDLRGKRVLLRMDWNVALPAKGQPSTEGLMKIQNSIATIKMLAKRGAIVILLTHVGRPEKFDAKLSTKRFIPLLKKRFHSAVQFHPDLRQPIKQARPGSIYLLENVRFEEGESSNDLKLAQAYAKFGDLYMNDAFASWQAQTTIVGIPKFLPAYAGPELVKEVTVLSRLLSHPKRPFFAVIGGGKISTKLPVIKSLLKICDGVCVGGAIANVMPAREAKNKKIFLPVDVVRSGDEIRDMGPKTLVSWRERLKSARTILWNGPVGMIEDPRFAKGSLALARMLAQDIPSSTYKIVGGGDTIPLVAKTKTTHQFDHVSMGGGAMLEFLIHKGRLPGLVTLQKK
ncbi:phosphoglycerate kinase [Candidatus Uhrbacteria bacterium]|nr:phosphoglycerate kinase [Candidatus Uhrbacteria bacterium]